MRSGETPNGRTAKSLFLKNLGLSPWRSRICEEDPRIRQAKSFAMKNLSKNTFYFCGMTA
jgi:hypothetical protein